MKITFSEPNMFSHGSISYEDWDIRGYTIQLFFCPTTGSIPARRDVAKARPLRRDRNYSPMAPQLGMSSDMALKFVTMNIRRIDIYKRQICGRVNS